MGEHDHISTTGVPSRNNASNQDCGFQPVQKAVSAKLLCNQQFHEWVMGLDTGPSTNKQGSGCPKWALLAISNLVSVLARRGLPLELLLLQVSLGGQEERQDADNAGHANDPVRAGLLRETQQLLKKKPSREGVEK